ncbi:MAG: LPS-assembly protein LptD [Cellvibrionaceae bacterium]
MSIFPKKQCFRRSGAPLSSRQKPASSIYVLSITVLSAFSIIISSSAFSTESPKPTHTEWSCKANGEEWVCSEATVPGPAYTRPIKSRSGNGSHNNSGKSDKELATANQLHWIPIEHIDPALIKESEKNTSTDSLDKKHLIAPDQLKRLQTGCCGVYMPPVREDSEATKLPEDSPARITSLGSMDGNPETILRFSGGVTVVQGSRQLKAEKMEMNEIEQTASMEGNIQIREGNSLIIGDSARLNRETGEANIENSQFIFYETGLRGRAMSIERGDETSMTLTGGEFTQCEPGQEHWLIKGSNITIDQLDETATGKNIRLELGGVPVFYFPYISFPTGNTSKSGLLYPSFSSDDFPLPLYWSIAPNYDLTFTPRYLSERGISYELETRHLNQRFETTLAGAWLGNARDEISDNEQKAIDDGSITREEAILFDGQDRWLGSIQQTGGTGEHWFTKIDYTKVSDYAYFHHIDTANLDINRGTHLRQSGEVGYNFENWLISGRVEQYQSIVLNSEEPYKQKPRLSAAGDYQWNNVTLNMTNEITRFEHRENDASHINGERLRLDYQADWTKEWLWGFFKPTILLKTLAYQLDDKFLSATENDKPNYIAPQASIDFGLFFERDGNWFGKEYLQTFEPQLFYFYSRYEDQSDIINQGVDFDTSELTFSYSQLFRHTRFAGGDRIDDANQFSIGLTSRFIGDKGAERLRLSIGQIYYQEDRRVTLLANSDQVQSKSEIAGQVSAQLTDDWRITSDILYDPTERHANKGSLSVRYLDEKFRIFNLGYRYTRKPFGTSPSGPIDLDDSQLEASFVWPIAGNWSVIARNVHDFTYDRELDSILGIEYTSCCYRVRLMGRKWLDNELINVVDNQDLEYDQGIFLEIHLRGLGLNIGNRIGNALSEGIMNYDRREEDFLGP